MDKKKRRKKGEKTQKGPSLGRKEVGGGGGSRKGEDRDSKKRMSGRMSIRGKKKTTLEKR